RMLGGHGGTLNTEDLAFQALRELDIHALGADEGKARVVVRLGEINQFVALVGNRHGADDHVDLAGVQRRDNAGPRRWRRHALTVHFFAYGLRDLDLEAGPFTAG